MRNLTPSEIQCKRPDYPDRKSQRARILRVLIEAGGAWVPLLRILDLKISQYGTRIKELRDLGFCIENRKEHVDGICHSWFRLVTSPAPQLARSEDPKPIADSADWFTSATGKPRPSVTTESLFLWERGQ